MRSSAQKRSWTPASLRPAPARNSFKSLFSSAASGAVGCAKTAAEEKNNSKTVKKIRPMRTLLPAPRPSKKGGGHHIPADASGTDFFREAAFVTGRVCVGERSRAKKETGLLPEGSSPIPIPLNRRSDSGGRQPLLVHATGCLICIPKCAPAAAHPRSARANFR